MTLALASPLAFSTLEPTELPRATNSNPAPTLITPMAARVASRPSVGTNQKPAASAPANAPAVLIP